MSKKILTGAAVLLVIAQTNICFANESDATVHPELRAYQAPEVGMERFVIALPEKSRAEEGNYKVEIIPGKLMETDGVNYNFVNYQLETRVVQGWGYTYYQISGAGEQGSTLIGVDPNAPKKTEFVAGQSLLVNYNSRLPLVVYGPTGSVVRYKIWQTSVTAQQIPRG
jgi:ecotin